MCNLWFSNFAVVNRICSLNYPTEKLGRFALANPNFISIVFGFFNLNFAVILVQFSMFIALRFREMLASFEAGGHKWTRTTDLTLIRRAL